MKSKISFFILSLTLLLVSCSLDDLGLSLSDARHLTMRLNIVKEEFDSVATRSASSWEEGDTLFLLFAQSAGTISGYACYQADTKQWEVTYHGSLNQNVISQVSVYYFEKPRKFIENQVTLEPTTAIYADAYGSYILKERNLTVTTTIRPVCGRIRFKGEPGQTFGIVGLNTFKQYTLYDGNLTSAPDSIVTTIQSDGYTPYLYGTFTDVATPTLSIDYNATYSAECGTNILQKGKSGWMNLPTLDSHKGWNVKEHPVTAIELDSTTATISEGDTLRLQATVLPHNATYKDVAWTTTDSMIVAIRDSFFVAKKAGEATLTVTSVSNDTVKATCQVTVKEIPVSSVILDKTIVALPEGDTLSIHATVLPANASNKALRWESVDKKIATVDEKGIVTAVKVGSTTIKAFSIDNPNAVGSCVINVSEVPVTAISISQQTASIFEGDTLKLSANILPLNASNKNVTWMTANKDIATVDNKGVVVGKKAGVVVISVSPEENALLKANCTVTVKEVPVSSITLNKTSAEVMEGDTLVLKETVLPTNASNKTVSWSSSNTELATVEKGIVTAKKTGEVTITATSVSTPMVKATCNVKVTEIPVDSITSVFKSFTLDKGQSVTFSINIYPSTATNKKILFSSSDEKIATVNDKGLITAISGGHVILTAVSDNNPSAKTTCIVYVLDQQFIDLGLPSGTLWATTNIGAAAPEDYGYFFSWGETHYDKQCYNWSTYRYSNEVGQLSKYCDDSNLAQTGRVDGKSCLEEVDDAAHHFWGDEWQMPSYSQFNELMEQCSAVWTTQNGIDGYKFTSKKNGKSIFLPGAGYRDETYHKYEGSQGWYWSNKNSDYTVGSNNRAARCLNFTSLSVSLSNQGRAAGLTIRSVYKSIYLESVTLKEHKKTMFNNQTDILQIDKALQNVKWSSSNANVVSVTQEGSIKAISAGHAVITVQSVLDSNVKDTCHIQVLADEDYNGHEFVDLGLPSGTLWATTNVGTLDITTYGDSYCWGAIEKTNDDWSNYIYCNGTETSMTKYCLSSEFGIVDH